MSTFSDQVREIAADLCAKADMWHADNDNVARCFSDASDALYAAANYIEDHDEMAEPCRRSE